MTPDLPDRLPLLGLEGIVLRAGSHDTRDPSALCAMETVAWIAGEPHSDHPLCACPVIGAFLRTWHDGLPTDEDRTRWLRPLLPLVVNTRASHDVERRRSYLALDWLVRTHAPSFLALSPSLAVYAAALRDLPPLHDEASCRAAQSMIDAAWAAAGDAAGAAAAAAWAAERTTAWALALAATRAAAVTAEWGPSSADAVASAVAAASAAAPDAFGSTVLHLQHSAVDLVKRMVAES